MGQRGEAMSGTSLHGNDTEPRHRWWHWGRTRIEGDFTVWHCRRCHRDTHRLKHVPPPPGYGIES